MKVTQKLQPFQYATCLLFEDIEGRGAKLEWVVTSIEQCLEGPMNEVVNQNEVVSQEFTEQEALVK
jgi:hypothetical protein